MGAPHLRRQVVVSGIRLTYLEHEPGSRSAKAPLVLLHGLVATADSFDSLLHALPKDRRAIALDLLSAEPATPGGRLDVTFQGLAKLIVDFATALGLDRPIIIGHSHGGVLALQIAVSFQSIPNGLILICPAHPFGGYNEAVVGFYLNPVGKAFASILPHLPRRVQMFGINRMTGPDLKLSLDQSEPYCAALRLPKTVPRVLRLIRSWRADMAALRNAMEQAPIRTPTLLLWGEVDPVVPIRTASALESHLAQWQRSTLPGVGHLPVDEVPGDCAALIRSWLIDHESGVFAEPSLATHKLRGTTRPPSTQTPPPPTP